MRGSRAYRSGALLTGWAVRADTRAAHLPYPLAVRFDEFKDPG